MEVWGLSISSSLSISEGYSTGHESQLEGTPSRGAGGQNGEGGEGPREELMV